MADVAPAGDLPTGLLTYLFTDIEDSTRRWEANPTGMAAALELHDQVLGGAIDANGGKVFKRTGDGFAAVFTSPTAAVTAAIEGQLALQGADWSDEGRLKVRMGAHIGEAILAHGDYYGPPVNRAARVMDVGNGDQIAVSEALAKLVSGVHFSPMGNHVLKGIGTERISFVHDERLVRDEREPRTRVAEIPRTLPPQTHELIGRDDAVKAVVALFDAHRIVTLVGAGGVGKSRLAIDVGQTLADRYPDGVVLCELAPVGDDASVDDAVAAAIGARAQPDMTLTESIVNYLDGKQFLLVLDNCEHVSSAVRSLVDAVLAVPGPAVLATSRESTGAIGEQLYGLSPLDPETAGVDLFLARARERDVAFDPRGDDLEAVREVSRRLDGVPLAIELAAAWVRVLSPTELVERLDDRFRVLRGGRRGGRHETLRDTIRWSYEQLDETEAALFDRLSVFAGGCTLDAVNEICAGDGEDPMDTLDTLMVLVNKSMLTTQRGTGRIRFTMLETLRQFGQEQLDQAGASETFFDRHADYFASMVSRESEQLISAKESETWEHLSREWPNIRAAFDSILATRDHDRAARLVLELGDFAVLSMRFELFEWLDELLAAAPVEERADAGALLGLAAIRSYLTVRPDMAELAERALATDPEDPYGFARISLAAEYLNNVHDPERAEVITSDWLTHLDSARPASRMWGHGMRTFHLVLIGEGERAAEQAALLRAIADRTGSASANALACWAEGMVTALTDLDGGEITWDQGLDAARSVHPVHLVVHLIVGLIIHFSAGRGELPDVLDRCRAILDEAIEHHYLAGTGHLMGVTAIVLARAGDAATGARLIGAMEANGHLPRPNAVRAIERAAGDDLAGAKASGARLSIKEAGTVALAALDDAIATIDRTEDE